MSDTPDKDFESYFVRAVGKGAPYAYQTCLAQEAWPALLDVLTGMGKTAGLGQATLYLDNSNFNSDSIQLC